MPSKIAYKFIISEKTYQHFKKQFRMVLQLMIKVQYQELQQQMELLML